MCNGFLNWELRVITHRIGGSGGRPARAKRRPCIGGSEGRPAWAKRLTPRIGDLGEHWQGQKIKNLLDYFYKTLTTYHEYSSQQNNHISHLENDYVFLQLIHPLLFSLIF